MDLNSSGISGKDDNEKSSLTKSKLAPIAIQTVESGIAILAGGTDKSGNYVIFFPPKKQAMIATQFAFGSHLVQLIQYLIGIATYTGVYRRKFSFYADLRDMNYGATESIVKSLTTVYHKTTGSHVLVDSLLVVKPKDKKLLKALYRIVGVTASKSKSDDDFTLPKPPYPVHILNDIKELHRKIDVSQLPLSGGGYMPYSHQDFVSFIRKFEDTRSSVDSSMESIDELLDELEQLNAQDVSKLDEAELITYEANKKRIAACLKEIKMGEMTENLKKYRASLLDRTPYNASSHSHIPASILIEVAVTVARDCLDEIKTRKDRYKLLDMHNNLFLTPLYKLTQQAEQNKIAEKISQSESIDQKSKRASDSEISKVARQKNTQNSWRQQRFEDSSGPRLAQSKSISSSALMQSLTYDSENNETNLANEEYFNELYDEDYNKDQFDPNEMSALASRRLQNSLFIPISNHRSRNSTHSLAPNRPYNSLVPRESLSRFKKRQREHEFQKSVPNLNEIGYELQPVENGMRFQHAGDARSTGTLDDVMSPPLSGVSYSSGEVGYEDEEPNYNDSFSSPGSKNFSPRRRQWEKQNPVNSGNMLSYYPRGSNSFTNDSSPGGVNSDSYDASPLELQDASREGYELLSWFRGSGLSYLEQSQVGGGGGGGVAGDIRGGRVEGVGGAESAYEAEQQLQMFETHTWPKCMDRIEQAEEWLLSNQDMTAVNHLHPEDSAGRGVVSEGLWEELQFEVVSFRKCLHRMQHQHQSVNNFFTHVRKALHWYKMIMREMPERLLDEKKRPDGDALAHYVPLSDQQHDQMKAIKQKFPHLSPAIATGVNKHMIYITDFAIRMEARQLVQRCILIDKLINVYSQDAHDAIKAIYRNRRGPSSLPTPDNSSSSLHLADDDSLGEEPESPGVSVAMASAAGASYLQSEGDQDEEWFRYDQAPARSRNRRLPDKKSRHNRSLPSFSIGSGGATGVGGGAGVLRVPGQSRSPANSSSPTFSQRSYMSTSSTASSSTNNTSANHHPPRHSTTGINYISQRTRHPSRVLGAPGSVASKLQGGSSPSSSSSSRSGGRSISKAGSMTNLRSHARMDAIHEHPN